MGGRLSEDGGVTRRGGDRRGRATRGRGKGNEGVVVRRGVQGTEGGAEGGPQEDAAGQRAAAGDRHPRAGSGWGSLERARGT